MNKIQFSLFLFIFPLFIFFFNVPITLADETITFGTTNDSQYNIYGNGLSSGRWGENFVTSGTASTATFHVYLLMTGSSSDNVTVGIYTNSASAPDTLIEETSLPLSSLTGSCAEYDFEFTSLGLSSATTYWVVIDKDGTPDADNHPIGCADDTPPLGGSLFRYQAGDLSWNTVSYAPYASIDLVTGGGGGGSATSTSGYSLATTTDVQVLGQLSFYALILFFISLITSIWIWKSFML